MAVQNIGLKNFQTENTSIDNLIETITFNTTRPCPLTAVWYKDFGNYARSFPRETRRFFMDSSLLRLLPPYTAERFAQGKISEDDVSRFLRFLKRKQREIDQHAVIVRNPYTKWFKQGRLTTPHVVDLVKQFSVFSNYFRIIQCKRMVLADTDAAEECARSILANEIGVGIDIAKGDTEGKSFHHKNSHLVWLRDIGEMLGISRRDLGRWKLGTPATHAFLTGLEDTYASRDGPTGAGASFAIETWAGFGIGTKENDNNFWQELIAGLATHNKTYRAPANLAPLNLKFFKYHYNLETGHVMNVERELEETFFNPEFDEEKWLAGAHKALDAIYMFWDGLDAARKTLA
jgi:hypothetical protein